MTGEIKIVINLKGNVATVGLQKPDCDPIFSRVEGDMSQVLDSIPQLVEDAQRSWDSNPRYRKCETDLTPPAPPAPRAPTQRTRQTATEQPQLI